MGFRRGGYLGTWRLGEIVILNEMKDLLFGSLLVMVKQILHASGRQGSDWHRICRILMFSPVGRIWRLLL